MKVIRLNVIMEIANHIFMLDVQLISSLLDKDVIWILNTLSQFLEWPIYSVLSILIMG